MPLPLWMLTLKGFSFLPTQTQSCARVLQTLPGFPCSILCARLVHVVVGCHFWHVHDAPGLHQPFGGKGKPLKLRRRDQVETCRGLGIDKGNSQQTLPEPKVILEKNRSRHDLCLAERVCFSFYLSKEGSLRKKLPQLPSG